MMRGWIVPCLLALLAMPSVYEALGMCTDLLAGEEAVAADALLLDVGQAALMVGLAVVLLSLRRRPPTMPLWLLDRRVLVRAREPSDRA